MDAPLHPDVETLAPLLGTWTGTGAGTYPTIEPFSYREEVVFGHVGKPFLAYRQATVRLDTGLPAHAEAGYLRGVGGGRLELVLVHPTGIAEVAEGEAVMGPDHLEVRLVSVAVTRTATAKEVTEVERTITVDGDVLRYDVAMAAVGQPLQHHLAAELRRAG
ncbi:MAG TPA: FABP family protein [Acidimicrobiales bacterium]|nr:FABP family protein [Acidimicrobiales bacterium]